VKKPIAALVLAVAVAVAIAVPATATTSLHAQAHAAASKTIKVGDFFFVKSGASDPTVTVKKNTKVTWKWVGKQQHDVSVTGPKKFHSKLQAKGSYSQKLTKKGTYKVICTIHPFMTMKLKVK
jgi:plastocyanin